MPVTRAVVVHDDAETFGNSSKTPREARRVDDRGAIWHVEAPKVRWRLHSLAHCMVIKQHGVLVVAAMHCLCLLDLFEVPCLGRDTDDPGLLEADIEVVGLDETDDRAEILLSETLQTLKFLWPVGDAVADAVRQGRLEKAAVARACAETCSVGLEDDDGTTWGVRDSLDSRPKAAETCADDDEIRFRYTNEWLSALGCLRIVGPEDLRFRIGHGSVDVD